MARWTAVLLAAPLLTLLVPGAAAHPVDGFAFTPFYVVPFGAANCVPGSGVSSPGCLVLPPVTVTGALTNLIVVGVTGAGACNVAFEACFAWPTWNPFRQAAPLQWWCQVTSHSPNWPAGAAGSIAAHVLYDRTNDDLLTSADVVDSALAIGPLPIPAGSPRAGAWTGEAFSGGGYPVGSIAHIVVTADGLVPDPRLDTVVTCWVF
jgi:hypothetical protein